MGARKRLAAEANKEARKSTYIASLNNCPTSPRKMRYVADMVRGMEVEKALHVLRNSTTYSSLRIRKLLLSAIANWQSKNEGARIEQSHLYIKEISVDSGRILKRIRPAPQGRAHRIRKRSNHVTLILDSRPVEQKTEA
ncbi:MAG TPA: 50S ribosomal protein L22 [Bacteroidales bacterium]|nr:50S ribosomal protein L22 [Bacteroidales bacterium]